MFEFDVLWRVLGMAFLTYKTQQLFGYALVVVGWRYVIYYHPSPIAGVMMLPLMLVGCYHTWAGYLRYKRERIILRLYVILKTGLDALVSV